MRIKKNGHRSLVVALAIASASVTKATSIPWLSTIGGGNFSTGINWTGGLVPGSSDIASFDAGIGYTVSFSTGVSNNQLLVAADNITFDLKGETYSLGSTAYTAGDHSIEVGSILGGTLNLESTTGSLGTLSGVYASIGVLPVDTGSVNLLGPKVALNASTSLYVGDGGIGALNIQNGATASDLIGALGNGATGAGSAVIDGAGSSWKNADYLYVGYFGTGSLTVQNGGQLSGDASYVGRYAAGNVTLTGAGSKWTANSLNIAYAAPGTLTIANGATLSDADAYTSSYPAAVGVVNISGANSTWTNSDTLYIGMASATTLNINGGLVSVAKTFGISNRLGTQVNLSGGGTLRIGSMTTGGNPSLFLGDGLTTGWTSGTLDITASNLSIGSGGPLGSDLSLGIGKTLRVSGNGKTLSIAAGSTVNVDGGSVYANTLNNAGTLSLPQGSSVEAVNPLVNTGLIDISGGMLQLDAGISGSSVRSQLASAYDRGKWDGTSGITSSAASSDPTNATGVGYITSGSTTDVIYTWYGDADGNGVVNGADASAVIGTGTTWQTGDFNYDGAVNGDDWSLFFLGSLYGSKNISTRLPEPTALAMLLPMAGLMRRRR